MNRKLSTMGRWTHSVAMSIASLLQIFEKMLGNELILENRFLSNNALNKFDCIDRRPWVVVKILETGPKVHKTITLELFCQVRYACYWERISCFCFRFLKFVTFGNRELPMFIGIIEVGVPSSTALSNGELAHGVLLKYHGSMLGDGVV